MLIRSEYPMDDLDSTPSNYTSAHMRKQTPKSSVHHEEDRQAEQQRAVLDLPQLYTRPSAKTLLATLADLSSEPASWSTTPRSGTPGSRSGTATPFTRKRKVKSEGVPAYLTKIISSRLAWLAVLDVTHDTHGCAFGCSSGSRIPARPQRARNVL